MNKEYFIFSFLSMLINFNNVHAYDVNVCESLSNVVSMNQDRYDQALIAYDSRENICNVENDKAKCVQDLKNEFESSKRDLQLAKNNFEKAGCDKKVAYVKFILKNGKKILNIQNIPSKNLYIINFGFEWAYFSPEHLGGYNFQKSSGGGIYSPSLNVGCFIADPVSVKVPISGFINGLEGGTGALQLTLKGKCQPFIDALNTQAFSMYFKDIQSMQANAPATPILWLYIQDLPN